jgi:hypothetical protein
LQVLRNLAEQRSIVNAGVHLNEEPSLKFRGFDIINCWVPPQP